MDEAVVSYGTRHSALLPSDHWISLLVTRHAHQYGHSGIAATTGKTRKRWHIENRKVKVDDIVTVANMNAVRGKWAVGRVTKVYPGADGHIQNITVKTATREYSCPVTKIAVIHPAEGDD